MNFFADSRAFTYLVDLVGVGVLLISGDRIVHANGCFARLVGMPQSALHGASIRKLAGEAWSNAVAQANGWSEWADALPWPMPDGGVRWFEVTTQPTELGGETMLVATCIDVTLRMRAEGAEARMSQLMMEIIEGGPVGMFVVNAKHEVTHWNLACERLTGVPPGEVVGTSAAWKAFHAAPQPVLANLVVDGVSETRIFASGLGECRRSTLVDSAYEATAFFPHMGMQGRWLHITAAPLHDAAGRVVGAVQTLIDITEQKEAEAALLDARTAAETQVAERTQELKKAKAALEQDIARRERAEQELLHRLMDLTNLNIELQDTQAKLVQTNQQLVQSEKMASIGQLSAGVAHEINNPIGYVFSNFGTLQNYLDDLIRLLDAYQRAEESVADEHHRTTLAALRKEVDLDYLRDDIHALMRESREGIERVRKIVQDLKEFSHADTTPDWQVADLHRGLESTLNIAHNEIKYKAEVVREFGDLPPIQCLPSQLNQVFMNLLVNAAQAMDAQKRGRITVRTRPEGDEVCVEIEDTGSGMSEEVLGRIFDPFFTTKPVGKGTGLGLSLSYGIVQKHHGRIEVESTQGVGTTFRIWLPVRQPQGESALGVAA